MICNKGAYIVDNEFNSEAKFSVLTRRLESLERNVNIKPVEFVTHTSSIPSDCTNQRISSLEESMSLFMQATQRSMESLQQQLNQLASQLNEQDNGQVPRQIQPHHKGSFEESTSGVKPTHHDHAFSTLSSGRVIDNHVSGSKDREQDRNMPTFTQVTPSTQKETNETEKGKSEIPYVPRAPFPQASLPRKKGASPNDILEVFKQVNVNIPLLDAIKQIPSYAKFLRDMCTVKQKLNVHKNAFLTEQVSSIITQRTPPKFKDPGCPTIACTIGEHRIEHALLDLGASVNLLPYSVYVQLELGNLKPANVTLQLVDRSTKIPRGVVEDVLIQVESFIYPVDFIVLDTQLVSNPSGKVPVILGRPFLATSNAVINCRNGIMELTFENMKMEINVFHLLNSSPVSETFEHVCMIDSANDSTYCYNENLENLKNMSEKFADCKECSKYELSDICLSYSADSDNYLFHEIVALNLSFHDLSTSFQSTYMSVEHMDAGQVIHINKLELKYVCLAPSINSNVLMLMPLIPSEHNVSSNISSVDLELDLGYTTYVELSEQRVLIIRSYFQL
ncbi:uncharacterized protein LOC113320815 [Papaver somniferum]|uniref:uncharacterized protein LOC113320815 n=1 Tax=Papaver somniferum TaxID=3469 RepID=UPI000E70238A|nr:uncharacterized protein LOC113320815 [Papaver somniferum]